MYNIIFFCIGKPSEEPEDDLSFYVQRMYTVSIVHSETFF